MQALKLVQALMVYGYTSSTDLHIWKDAVLSFINGFHDLPSPSGKASLRDNFTGIKYNEKVIHSRIMESFLTYVCRSEFQSIPSASSSVTIFLVLTIWPYCDKGYSI